MTKLLSRRDVMNVLQMDETIDILQKAFAELATERAVMPQRTPIATPDHGGVALFMPAYLKGMGALGAKVVTVYKDNPAKHQKPTVMGTIILLDQQTGEPLAIMDGGYLTAMRTGAVAGLATRLLARNNAQVHTMFGTGGMARSQAWAIGCARNIRKLVLFSLDPITKRREFAASLKDVVTADIVLADHPNEAVREADIVTLITSAKDPIVKSSWFKEGAHINGIGAHAPSMREIDSDTVARSKVVCDDIDACKAEAGDLIIPVSANAWSWDKCRGSLGDVIVGKVAGRENEKEITLFKSVGLAIQDMSTAFHVYNKAVAAHVGTDFTF